MDEILYLKALDQVAYLNASYETGRITAETFRIGIETIWAVLGGVVDREDFQDLMHEANTEVAALPASPHVKMFYDGNKIFGLSRTNKVVRMCVAEAPQLTAKERVTTYDIEDEAIGQVRRTIQQLSDKGFKDMSL